MKTKRLFIMLTVFMMALAMILSACGNNEPSSGTKPVDDKKEKDGWEKINSVDNKEMFTKFLLGFTNVAYELSKDRVKEKGGAVTLDGTASFSINGNKIYLDAKGKYDNSDPGKIREKTMAFVTLATDDKVTDDTRLVSAGLYRDELYLALANNKVKFDVSKANWTDYYPYPMKQQTSNELMTISSALTTYIKLKSNPTGYTRRNSSKEEFKFSMEIDVKSSLTEIIKNLATLTKNDTKLILQVNNFISGLLGVSPADLVAGKIPDSSLKIEFMTSGKTIQSLTADIKVDMKGSDSKIIDEDELKLKAKIDNLKITNQYASGVTIDFVNDNDELKKYIGYDEAIYMLEVPVKVYDEKGNAVPNSYVCKLATQVFQADPKDNFIFAEYYNTKTKISEKGFYVYNDIAYIFKQVEDNGPVECVHHCDLNLSELATRVVSNNLNGKSTLNVYGLVAYLLRHIAITEKEFRFAIDNAFFTDVWYNFDDMVAYIDSVDEDDIYEDENVMAFIDYMKNNEVIFTFKFHDKTWLNLLDGDSNYMKDVIGKLEDVLPPEETTEENTEENQGENIEETQEEENNEEENNEENSEEN